MAENKDSGVYKIFRKQISTHPLTVLTESVIVRIEQIESIYTC